MKKPYLHVFVIVIIGLIAYSNSFQVPFQFDDLRIIPDNQYIQNLDNFSLLKEHQYNPREEYNPRRYLGYLSLALNYWWGGLEVTGYHIVNLLIHLINGLLVYFFITLTFRTPYFTSKKPEVSGKREDTENDGLGVSDFSLLTTHNSLFSVNASEFIALFSALLFVAHPVQTQAVTYIAQRFTSLATLFYLASVVFYVKGRLASAQADKPSSSLAGRLFDRQACMLLLSLLSAVCAMKVKEISFTLPIIILLYELIFFRSTLKRKLLFLIPILLTLVIVPVSVLHIDKPLGELLSDLSEKSRLQTDMPRWDYLMTELRVIITYIRLIFLPVDQNLDYDYPIYHSFLRPQVFLSFLFLSALFATALYLLYKSRWKTVNSEKSVVCSEQIETEGMGSGNESPSATKYSLCTIHCLRLVAFGILWFFVALSVESSFIPIVDVIFEHRLYLPSVGAFIALSAALLSVVMKAKNSWPGAVKVLIPFALTIVLILAAVTFARNRVWQDEARLWEDVVSKSPGNARAHNNLCFVYIGSGKAEKAIQQCRAAVALRPDYLDAHVNLGVAYNARGMYDNAIENFLMALSRNPDDADAHNNLGIAYVSKGMFDEAITHYQIALKLWPGYAEAYNNLGVAYGSKGMYDQAIKYFEKAIELKTDYFEANYNLALLLEKMGDHDKAVDQFHKANGMKATGELD